MDYLCVPEVKPRRFYHPSDRWFRPIDRNQPKPIRTILLFQLICGFIRQLNRGQSKDNLWLFSAYGPQRSTEI